MSKVYIGIDNGTSGTIAVVGDGITPVFVHTPVKKEQNYTKAKKTISRLDCAAFLDIVKQEANAEVTVLMERPLVNPTRFAATTTGCAWCPSGRGHGRTWRARKSSRACPPSTARSAPPGARLR